MICQDISIGITIDMQIDINRHANRHHNRQVYKMIPPIDLPIIKGASKILDRLYLGDYYDSIDTQQMLQLKVTHIVNMCPDTPKFTPIPGIQYHYVNILDVPQAYKEMESVLLKVVPMIDAVLKDPRTVVLIHCAYGMSRSATLTIGYVMYSQKMSFHHALDYVNRRRYIALPNVGFLYTLKRYGDYLDRRI